jgi:hypothetical protein
MNDSEQAQWHNLLAMSAPAFAVGETAPPYGFVTRVRARLETESCQREMMERVGLRALLASLAVLILTAAIMIEVNRADRPDFEPGLGGLLQAADVPLS